MELKVRKIEHNKEFEEGFCRCVNILSMILERVDEAEECYCHPNGLHYDIRDMLDMKVKDVIISVLVLSNFQGCEDYLFGFFVAMSEVMNRVAGGCFVSIETVNRNNLSTGMTQIFKHENVDIKGLKEIDYSVSGSAIKYIEHLKKELIGEFGCCENYKLNIVLCV